MGAFDDIKNKASELLGQHGDQAKEGVEKAGDAIDEKTGGEHAGQVDQGQAKANEVIDGLNKDGA